MYHDKKSRRRGFKDPWIHWESGAGMEVYFLFVSMPFECAWAWMVCWRCCEYIHRHGFWTCSALLAGCLSPLRVGLNDLSQLIHSPCTDRGYPWLFYVQSGESARQNWVSRERSFIQNACACAQSDPLIANWLKTKPHFETASIPHLVPEETRFMPRLLGWAHFRLDFSTSNWLLLKFIAIKFFVTDLQGVHVRRLLWRVISFGEETGQVH